MSPITLLEILGISRRDNATKKSLLSETSLTIHGGDRIGLIGPSGSGKSTLLRGIAMLDQCTGQVRYLGETISGDAVPAYRRRVVYLPQRPSFSSLTILDNLQLPFQFASPHHSRDATRQSRDTASATDRSHVVFDRQETEKALAELGLSVDILEQPTEQLSGGEQQLVALVRALSIQPQILLLDEPTASLDSNATRRFEQRVMNWHSEYSNIDDGARAFIWTSHDPEQVRRLTERVMTVESGVVNQTNSASTNATPESASVTEQDDA